MDNKKYLDKFNRCIYEYTSLGAVLDEGDEEMGGDMPMDPGMEGGAPEGGDMPMDPGMEGGTPEGGDMPMEPGMEGGAPEGGVEGFNPEGEEGPMDGMGGDPNAEGGDMPMEPGMDTMQPDDEVIDVDDLTKSQESAEKKIDAMNSKFEKLMGAVEVLIKQNAEKDKAAAEAEKRANERQAQIEAELEKRMPTPQQRMTMRSTKSAPYSMSPNEYMNNYAPDNYSDADDNNGADDTQYQITKDDIDRFTDYASIAKELDVDHQGLHDILGF